MESLTLKSFSFICRTCLMYQDILFNINDVQWEDMSLNTFLESCISLNQSLKNQMPPNMCKSCVKTAYYFYEFVNKCRKSEKFLKENLNLDMNPMEEKKEFNHEIEYDMKNNFDDEITNDFLIDNDFFIDSVLSSTCDVETTSKHLKNNDDVIENIVEVRVQNTTKKSKLQKAKLISDSQKVKRKKMKKKPPYNCITCQSTFETYESLRKHKIETKHKKSLKFICEHCNKRYDAYSKYVEHCRTHTGEKPNICEICGKAFNFRTDLKRHMLLHEDSKPHTCRFCDKGFTRKQYLIDHERKHTGEKLICSFCGRGFHSYSTLVYHEKTHKGPPGAIRDPKTADRHFKCDICNKVLLTEGTLRSHVLLHGPKNFNCEKCGKTYISKQRLQDHIRFAHKDQTFTCEICQKIYRHKNGLEIHMKSHYGQNSYPCQTCNKKFACKSSLYQHRRIHTGDTTYQCTVCLHICINKRHLENHLRTHTGEKPFACVFCGKAFAQKANMVAHSRVHTEEKNHWCKECGKGFYERRGLKKHMVIHEKPEPDLNIPLEPTFVNGD